MKLNALLIASLFAVACGGGGGGARPMVAETPDPDEPSSEEDEPIADEEPEAPPEPPPPQQWRARADLAPIKGSKMKPGAVLFSQTEGEGVAVATEAPLAGLKAGTYHLVIHASAECGKNAAKVGPAWEGAAAVELAFTVTKATPGSLDESEVELTLDGEESLVGHTLVVHADKKGKPGKAEACGVIVSDEADAADAGDPEE